MRLSQLFFKTFKEAPQEADVPSHQLLERAGFIKRLSRGHFTYTPIMWRVLKKLMDLVRCELEKFGAQEVFMPQLQTKEIWDASGRWEAYKAEKLTYIVKDRDEHEYCLGPTHEEVVTHLMKHWVTSYKQLPLNLYQITNKFRDEIRPRFGLMRAKEFLMKDAYCFCASEAQMQEQYQNMRVAYQAILNRLELDYAIVQADAGKIGNSKSLSEEFQVLAHIGEDTVLVCEEFAFNSEKAPCQVSDFDYPKIEKPLEKCFTPNVPTMEKLQAFIKLPMEQLLKILIVKLIRAEEKEEFVALGIRGDLDVNLVKVVNFFNALEVELATDEELKKQKLTKGFIGPVDCPIPFYADESLRAMKQFVCGANEIDHHFLNVEWKRDCPEPIFHDFCQAKAGDLCPLVPGKRYEEKRGIEVGHIFVFGDKYSVAMDVSFQDEEGKNKPMLMGSFGIGIGRLAQAVVEQKYDEKGIFWPKVLAPYQVLLTAVNSKDEEQVKVCESIYSQLQKLGVEVLYDDRKERLGFKLKDSDLIGIPFKMIIGKGYFESKTLEIEPRKGDKLALLESDLETFAKAHLLV